MKQASVKRYTAQRLPFWEKGEVSEKLLQYIWQFQYFQKTGLRTTDGEAVEIISPGTWNHHQGPDFFDAQVRIGDVLLAGSVELHVRTSLWKQHGHDGDANYRNVILHVVYEHNAEMNFSLPVVELRDRIPHLLLDRYRQLMDTPGFIPCGASLRRTPPLVWTSWKERLVAERLTRKAALIEGFLKLNQLHWQETFWWMLARNFGVKINTDAFEAMARSIPMRLLSRHRNQIHQLEALLLGQSGLLEKEFGEAYPQLLQREYRFLKKKYGLRPIHAPIYFLRMRPQNFPTVRLAQLAMLVHSSDHLLSSLIDLEELPAVRALLTVTANDYWNDHYLPGEKAVFKKKTLGRDMIENIIINTVVPMIFAYGLYQKDSRLQEKAIRWLELAAQEHNSVTKGFTELGVQVHGAFDTQALLELRTHYCLHKRCLQCAVGNSLLKSGP